jgi:Amidohydrolase family
MKNCLALITVISVHLFFAADLRADLAITHVTVIDGNGQKPMRDATVLIHENRIVLVGKTIDVSLPRDTTVINGARKFLIPGLCDMHVHLFSHQKADPSGDSFFPLLIANGVTSVRDMWTKLDDLPKVEHWRKEFADGAIIPRIAAVGTIVDGPEPILPGADTVATPEQARRLVDRLKSGGIDFVKVYWNLPREEYFAIVEECRKQHMPFAGHTPFAVGALEASRAGQASIEHFTEIAFSCSSKEQELRKLDRHGWGAAQELQVLNSYDETKCRTLFSEFVKNHTWQDPTLVVFEKLIVPPEKLVQDPRLKYIPPATRGKWESFIALMKDRTPEEIEYGNQTWNMNVKLVKAMKNAGVQFLAGTDMGLPDVSFVYPGFSLHDELALLVQAGLTPMEALQAATKNAAEFLGLLSSIGTIEKGKLGDLVLLDADPLQDIHNTRRINAVILNGKLLTSDDLQRLLKLGKYLD